MCNKKIYICFVIGMILCFFSCSKFSSKNLIKYEDFNSVEVICDDNNLFYLKINILNIVSSNWHAGIWAKVHKESKDGKNVYNIKCYWGVENKKAEANDGFYILPLAIKEIKSSENFEFYYDQEYLLPVDGSKQKSGIILWECSPDLQYEGIVKSDYKEMLKNYPKLVFIDFNDVDEYSKSTHTFFMKNNRWYDGYRSNFDFLWHLNDTCYFSVVIDENQYLVGVSYLSCLSAQMPVIPSEDAVLLILTEKGNLKFSDTIYDIDGKIGGNEKSDFNYDLKKLEQYFKERKKLIE